jgi:hypothetical protein
VFQLPSVLLMTCVVRGLVPMSIQLDGEQPAPFRQERTEPRFVASRPHRRQERRSR